jgi:hypothetical protein
MSTCFSIPASRRAWRNAAVLLFTLVGGLLIAPSSAHAQYAEQTGSENPFGGISVPATPAALDAVAGDFDTDGDVDLLAYDGSDERFYANDGTGTFAEQTGSENPFRNLSSAFGTRGRTFARDIDADGDIDLVTYAYGEGGRGTLVLVENTDGATYAQRTGPDNPFDGLSVSGNQATVDAVMGDFSGDRAPDLLVYDGSAERYYKNDGSGAFTEQTGDANPFGGLQTAFWTKTTTLVRDFDGDGDLDIAFRDGTGGATAWRYRENTDAGFVARSGNDHPLSNVAADATAASVAIAAGDFDLDGHLDLLTDDAGTQRFYDGDGNGTYTEATTGSNPFDSSTADPALQVQANTVVGDLEPDADPDLAFAGTDAGGLRVVERTDVGIALVDGRDDTDGGEDYTPPSPTPDTEANPVGRFSLEALAAAGATLREVTVAFEALEAQGVEAVELWGSDDPTFAPSTAAPLTAERPFADEVTFSGLTTPLGVNRQYVFVVLDLATSAAGDVVAVLSDETDLAFSGGALERVNGTETGTFSMAYLSVAPAPLPVELARFDGEVVEGSVRLSWTTTSEDNNAGFQVQRRAGGSSWSHGSWSDVRFVEGAGTTSDPQTYRFTDSDIPYSADSLSYRLKQIDTGGTASLTDPITIARGGPAGLELLGTAPNPASRRATVRYGIPGGLSRKGEEVRLELYDTLGRQVRSMDLSGTAGRHTRTLDVSGLPSGMYLLHLEAGGQAVTRKLTVVR